MDVTITIKTPDEILPGALATYQKKYETDLKQTVEGAVKELESEISSKGTTWVCVDYPARELANIKGLTPFGEEVRGLLNLAGYELEKDNRWNSYAKISILSDSVVEVKKKPWWKFWIR